MSLPYASLILLTKRKENEMNLDEFREYVENTRKVSSQEAISKIVSATIEKENK